MKTKPCAAIIGGGPAGLMAAEVLVQGGARVDLFDAMPSVGRKFLMAGKGGMNLTHAEPADIFLTRYGTRSEQLLPLLTSFGSEALREWVEDLGFSTFIGSSGRVFPSDMKAAPLLRAWVQRLRKAGVRFHMRYRWTGWDEQHSSLCFTTPDGAVNVRAEAVILALGGGSWPRLGSDGAWVSLLKLRDVPIAPLLPANCGFEIGWSDFFRDKFAGHPLKSVQVSFTDVEGNVFRQQGDIMITRHGVEGGSIYALSSQIRNELGRQGTATIHLDLAPAKELPRLIAELSHPRGSRSMSSHLQSRANIKGVKTGLLRELSTKEEFDYPERLAAAIKRLPLKILALRPLEEAISSAGGVLFEALDEGLMVKSLPGLFCAGEMLDWEAPTGGYLLTACFSSGRRAGLGALEYFARQAEN